MAVMAAQARSLGFSLIFAAQDMPALEKRVKEEARSITANCNIKLFGKLEDPTQTKEFFEKTVGQAIVTEVSGFARNQPGTMTRGYMDSQQASVQVRARVTYDYLKGFTEGRAICAFGKLVNEMQIYNSDIGHAKAMRVHRFLPIPPPADDALESLHAVDSVLQRFRNDKWRADEMPTPANTDIAALAKGFADGKEEKESLVHCGILAVAAVAEAHGSIKPEDAQGDTEAPAAPVPAAPGVSPAALEAVEKAAAAVSAKVGGPLSWMEIIGSGEPSKSDQVKDAGAALATEATQGGISWENILGPAAPPATPPAAEPVAPPSEDKTEASKSLSWGDIIGGGDTSKDK